MMLVFLIWGELFYWTFNFYFAFLTMLVSKIVSSLFFFYLGEFTVICYYDSFILNMLLFVCFLLWRSEIGISMLNLNLNNPATNNRTKSVVRWTYQCMIRVFYDWEIDLPKWISDPVSLHTNATEVCTGVLVT